MPPGWLVLAAAAVIAVVLCLNRNRVGAWRQMVPGGGAIGAWAPHVLRATLLHAGFFVVTGLILWGLAAAIGGRADVLDPVAAVSVMAMAWWVGFVAPGSSAGVGVREVVLVLALEPGLGGDGAMLVALILRLITTCGDLLFFALCAVTRWDVAAVQEAGAADPSPIAATTK
jgi:hypothetical protein